jgi:hypothetical protein
MGNYDLRCQRFVLIHNASVKILPEDIIDIESFSDYLILDDEPEGFDEATLVLERDERYHGFNYEYSVDMLRYACDFGKRYLVDIFESDGTDADVKFVYGYGTINQFEVLYVGGLDFNQYTIENNEYVAINLRKDDFGNILQTAFDIPQSVEPTEDVLLYSKVIPKKVVYNVNNKDLPFTLQKASLPKATFEVGLGGSVTKGENGYIFFNTFKTGDDTELFPSYAFQVDGVTPIDPSKLKFLFRAKETASYELRVRLSLGLDTIGISNPTGFMNLVYIVTEPDGLSIKGTTTKIAPESFMELTETGEPDFMVNFSADILAEVDIDDCVYLYVEIDSSLVVFPVGGQIADVYGLYYDQNVTISPIEIKVGTLAPYTITKFIPPYNALNTIISKSAEVDYDVVVSDFFNGGCGSKLFLTNGFWVRGGDTIAGIESEKLEIKQSPKKLVDMFVDLFNMGWGIEYGGYNGEETIRLEPAEHFYQDNLLMEFDGESIVDYEKAVDPSKYYNELEFGFSRYSKDRETDKGNTIDDFHTKHTYQTPIKTNKNKLSVITDLILSAYELEILRRKQFETSGQSISANYNTDDDMFGVQLVDTVPFTGGTYTGLLTDLSDGDIIKFGTNDLILVGYQYFYVGQNVTVNVDGVAISTTVTGVNFGSFRPLGFEFDVTGTRITFSRILPPQIDVPIVVKIISLAGLLEGTVLSIDNNFTRNCFDSSNVLLSCGDPDEDYSIFDGDYTLQILAPVGFEIGSVTTITSVIPSSVTKSTTTVNPRTTEINYDMISYDDRDSFFDRIEIVVTFEGEHYETLTIITGIGSGDSYVAIENRVVDPPEELLKGYLVPESVEPFINVNNLDFPSTSYNIRHTPKRMLLSWAKMFNGGFRTKLDEELIEFRQGDGNTSLSTQFGEGETCLLGDIDRAVINEGSNLRLDQTYGRDYLFLPYKVSFSYPLTFDDLNYIRRSMRGMNEYDNYGYIQYVNPAGETEQVYLTSIKFMPSKEEATIEGYVKATFPVQFTGNYIIDENDQFVYDEVSLPIPYEINEGDTVDLSLDHTLDVEI